MMHSLLSEKNDTEKDTLLLVRIWQDVAINNGLHRHMAQTYARLGIQTMG